MNCFSAGRWLLAWALLSGFTAPQVSGQYAFSLDPASPSLAGGRMPGDILEAGPNVQQPGFTLGMVSSFPLGAFDNLDALSFGAEPPSASLLFSVDRVAVGALGSDVFTESAALTPEAAGDVFSLTGPGANALWIDEGELGLAAGFFGDDLDALAHPPEAPLTPSGAVYFSIDAWSQTNLTASGTRADDILMAFPGSFTFDLFADGLSLGLAAGDDLDALVLYDIVNPGVLDPGFDKALFSVSSFSPSTYLQTGQAYEAGVAGKLSPADVLLTDFTGAFTLFRSAGSLGLRPDDNLDALDISQIPEPSTAMLTGAALSLLGLGLAAHRLRRDREMHHVA